MNSPPFLIKDEMKNSGVDLDDIYEVWSKLGMNDSPNSRMYVVRGIVTLFLTFVTKSHEPWRGGSDDFQYATGFEVFSTRLEIGKGY